MPKRSCPILLKRIHCIALFFNKICRSVQYTIHAGFPASKERTEVLTDVTRSPNIKTATYEIVT